jgi:uncharacterized protein (DUF1697 family)
MKMVALLRGINVGGNRKVPMVELQSVAAKAGFTEIATYINSGNLIFNSSKLSAEQASLLLEKGIEKHFGFAVDVVIRTAAQWKKYASKSPFPDATTMRPHLLLLGLSKKPPTRNAVLLLSERANGNERIKIINDAIWVDFATGVGKSKLTPALFDKAVGSSVTMRNWKTVLKLNEMLSQTKI